MTSAVTASDLTTSLHEGWELRNAATATVVLAELRMKDALEHAGVSEIVGLLEAFSPAQSPGPAWTRSFEPLIERLWTWCSPEVLSGVEENFRGRGAPWIAVANSLRPEHGDDVRARLRRRSAQARLPAFTIE